MKQPSEPRRLDTTPCASIGQAGETEPLAKGINSNGSLAYPTAAAHVATTHGLCVEARGVILIPRFFPHAISRSATAK